MVTLSSILPALESSTIVSMVGDLEAFIHSSRSEPDMADASAESAAAVEMLKPELEARGEADDGGVAQSDAGGPENQGMQWLVVGMVPGPMKFLVGCNTRAEALAEMAEQNLADYEYLAVIKARDFFFVLPNL